MAKEKSTRALAEGLRVVEALSSTEQVEFTQEALARATGLTKNKVHRIVHTLKAAGWVAEGPGGARLASSFVRFAEDFRRSLEFRREQLDQEEKDYLGE